MQKSFNEDFDLQVRSMMDEAQEPAPAGAWEAISSRLDALQAAASAPAASVGSASAARHMGHRVWYWAGAALAMAAAVALGIFFTGTSDNNSNLININSGEALVAESETPVAAKPVTVKPVAVNTVAVTPVAAKPVAETPVTVTPAAETPAAETPAAVMPSASEPVASEQPSAATPDPFAQMAFEDMQKNSGKKSVSLLIKGGSTGNKASASKVSLAAPGAYAQTGITETSKSTFSVPVIAGLGVRLHLNDVLSIGSGIDYSLLARTFEGRYTDGASVKTGDFNHTLQYIGVPVDLFVNLVNRNDITLYSVMGMEAEYAVSNKYHLLGTDTVVGDPVNGLQWSLGAGLGLEFNVGKNLGIFAEPSFRFYFDCDQPKSIRTDKPFQMVLRAGVRFDL